MENLRAAFHKTSLGKHMSYGYLEFKEYAQLNLARMREQILDGSWRQGPFREFMVFEPKARKISALDFKDRVAQHALVNVIGPIFETSLLPYTFACRVGMGTHAGVKHVQASLRRTKATHYLKTDYSRYFPSVDLSTLHGLISRKIKCRRTHDLIRAMVPDSGQGLPIGSLTSQLFANVYGGVIDRFIHFELGARHWARYMDDIVLLSNSLAEAHSWFDRIERVSSERLGLKISKWQASPISRGINFLGYRIWPTHKLLRKDSALRAKRKIARMVKHGDTECLRKFVAAWSGHAKWADAHNLMHWMEVRYGIACG